MMSLHKKAIRNEIKIQGGQQRYTLIDFAKGFSILTIVIMHLLQSYVTELPELLKTALSLGGTGVHIFIFCSGFGLYLSHLKNPLSYKLFMKKRFSKIYLPYIVVVFICFFIPQTYTGNNRVAALLSHIFLYKMFIPEFEESFGGQLWFISTIIQFYFAFKILCRLKRSLKRSVFNTICMGISIIWWIVTAQTGLYAERIWGSFFLQYIWEFGLGMSCAEYLDEGKDICIRKWVIYIVAIVGIGLEGILALAGGFFKNFNDIFAFLGYGSVVLILYCFNCELIKKSILKISSVSYEWYLVHMIVFTLIFIVCPANIYLQMIFGVVAFFASFAIAEGYHWIINKVYCLMQKS